METRTMRGLAMVAVCAALAACGQTRTITLAPAAPDLFDRNSALEVTGSHVVAGRHGTVAAGSAEGAGMGMGQGAAGSLLGGVYTGNPLGLALGIALMPVFAIGGGIYGAAAAHSEEETGVAVAAMEAVYDDAALLGALEGKVEERVATLGFPRARTCPRPRPLPWGNPAGEGRCERAAPVNLLRLAVSYGFATEGVYSPDLRFAVEVSALAAGAGGGGTGREFRWVYASPALDFFGATADGGRGLRREIETAHERLAERIVDDLFLARRPLPVTGQYFPEREIEFVPPAIPPGTASRLPTQSELVELRNEEPEATPADPTDPAPRFPN